MERIGLIGADFYLQKTKIRHHPLHPPDQRS
jgi:hypothetical protein